MRNKLIIILFTFTYLSVCTAGIYYYLVSETIEQHIVGVFICMGGIAYICDIKFEKWKD